MVMGRTFISAFVFLFQLVSVRVKIAVPQSTYVNSLPGYQGTLPFKLETGNVGVGENEEIQLFYYFVESERDPAKDPLVLWHTGGPGCSSLSAIAYEIGPLSVDLEASNGGSASFRLNKYSWTKIANIIFLDSPVGTGFSYSTTSQGYHSSITKAAKDASSFLQKWLQTHPRFINNRLFIGGDSYAGKIVPLIALEISKGNQAGLKPSLAIQGYLLGNPVTDLDKDLNWRVPYAHRLGLIPDEYFQQAQRSCGGKYVNPASNNRECYTALEHYKECTRNINDQHILEPTCKPALDFLQWNPTFLQSDDHDDQDDQDEFFDKTKNETRLICRKHGYVLSHVWANDPKVREALHIREGTIARWVRCNHSLSFDDDVPSAFPYHQQLSNMPYQALVYSGDHDMVVPYLSTFDWVQRLNLSIDDRWRPWEVHGQNAGYTTRYRGSEFYMTFATIKGGGHTAQEQRPKECLTKRWFSTFPL